MDTRLPNRFDTAPSAVRNLTLRWQRSSLRLRVILAIAALALLVLLTWHYFGQQTPGSTPAPPPVTVATAQTRDVTAVENTIGTVVAVATVQVTSQVSGQLLSASFAEGQIVRADSVLFQIDPRPFAAALQQAQAALARDQANAISAAHDKARFLALAAQGAASSEQRDQAVAAADADATIVKADSAAIAAAQLNLGYATIRSPITGKTGPLLVQPGNLVTANNSASPLVTITQIQPIKVSVSLPQSDLPRLMQQMRAGKLNLEVNLHGGPIIAAPVNFIGNQVDARTGTIELRANFPNVDYRLVPGQLVDAGVTMNDYPDATVVPREAVNLGPTNRYVYVVSKDNLAQMRHVSVLYDDGTNAAVAGDIKPGDTVIVEGQLRVLPGKPVAIAHGALQP